ncbi:MAG: hypothetical protein ACUVWP_08685 [bacterium]
MKIIVCIFILSMIILISGCYYGNFQGARTTGEGKFNARLYGIFPAYLSSESKRNAEESGEDLTNFAGGLFMQYGATPRFDLGVQTIGYYSFGIHAKWQATPGKARFNVAPIIWLNYFIPKKTLVPKFTIVTSLDLSKRACLYLAYEGFYTPNVTKWDEVEDGKISWSDVEERWMDSIVFGADVTLQKGTPNNAFHPFGLSAELGFPLKNKYPVILFGIGIYY